MTGSDPEFATHLNEAWSRLELLCRRLWDENSPVALGLQAFIEEFGGETHRLEQLIQAAQKGLLEQQEKLARERARADALQAELLSKEEENAEFHHKFLQIEAAHDEERAKKMAAFYEELNKKSLSLEASWESRHKALEEEYSRRGAALQKRREESAEASKSRSAELERQYSKQDGELAQAHERMMKEMTAWESGNRCKDETILKREKELALRELQLKEEYDRKQSEFQLLKESLQREVAEIVKQYQAKLRNGVENHPPAAAKPAAVR